MSQAKAARRQKLRDVSLFVKLLVPFFVLLLVVGAAGAFLVVRDLSAQARAQLNQELLVHSLNARSRVHDRELYLLEAVDFAANLQTMASSVKGRNVKAVSGLLQSVLALKTDLNLLSVIDLQERALVEFTRSDPGGPAVRSKTTSAGAVAIVQAAMASDGPAQPAGLLKIDDEQYLVIATPICATSEGCEPVGVAVAGIRLDALVFEAAGGPALKADPPVIAIYDQEGALLAASGEVPGSPAPKVTSGMHRRNGDVSGREVASVYSPLIAQGTTLGSISAAIPVETFTAIARDAGFRLALLLFVAMATVVVIGVVLSRYLLAQVNPLVRTSRALGTGDLSARAPVVARDELGELAEVLNQMAEQLQASHETLERQVDERTHAIRELLEQRTEFFTGISHELRTPVAVILSEARMMLDPARIKKRKTKTAAAETIVRSGEQLLANINRILDLARMESGRVQLTVADISLSQIVSELRPTMTGLAAASGLDLSIEVSDELPRVNADPARMKDVVLNLVSNAVKYTPRQGKVLIAGSAHNGTVELTVSDTGVGIPPEVGNRVFEPFYQVSGNKPQGGQPSSGLGLALAKRLVEAQRGAITYKSVPNEGSAFTVALPPSNKPAEETRRGSQRRPRASGGK